MLKVKLHIGDILRDTDGEEFTVVKLLGKDKAIFKVTNAVVFKPQQEMTDTISGLFAQPIKWKHIPRKETRIKNILDQVDKL